MTDYQDNSDSWMPDSDFDDDCPAPDDEDLQAQDEDLQESQGETLEEAQDDSLKFRDFQQCCPNCRQPITPEMDSCPFCGDIIFRHLTDGIFAPKKGIFTKIFAITIILLVIMALLGLLFSMLP